MSNANRVEMTVIAVDSIWGNHYSIPKDYCIIPHLQNFEEKSEIRILLKKM